jgi:SAM-dependent methyltransferase
MNSIVESKQYYTKKALPNPIHAQPYHFASICNLLNKDELITISPKADGIFKQLIHNNIKLDAEYIKELDLYLILDTSSYPIAHNDNIVNRNKWIRSLLKIGTKNSKISSLSDLKKFIDDENNDIMKYISENKNPIKIFPKSHFELKVTIDELIAILDETPNTIYPNDGWIVIINNSKYPIIKFKPKCHLSVDLLYSNKKLYTLEQTEITYNGVSNMKQGIWRCYWDDKINTWYPKEYRDDKKSPNPNFIVSNLTNTHLNYWTNKDVKKFVVDNIYYTHCKNTNLDISVVTFLSGMNDAITNTMFKLSQMISDQFTNIQILELGCGSGAQLKNLKNCIKNDFVYTGIDIDPLCITKLQYYNKNSNYKAIWGNLNEPNWGYFENITNLNNNLILMINTIHYFMDNFENFSKNLSKYSVKGAYLLILTLPSDNITEDLMFSDKFSITKQENNIYKFKYPWLNKEFTEHLYTKADMIDNFKNTGWELQSESLVPDININETFSKFTNFHNFILLQKTI